MVSALRSGSKTLGRKRKLHFGLATLAALALTVPVRAQANLNLGRLGYYADPEAHLFAGQYWIYPTSSNTSQAAKVALRLNPLQEKLRHNQVVHAPYLSQTYMDSFSSPDLVHWMKHPGVLDIRDIPWAAYALWAPSVIQILGKYYIFFAANDIQEHDTFPGGIGVAESTSPDGPFIDLLGKPLVGEYHNGAQPIDPMVFQDDDGSLFLYYGGHGHCNVARLSSDLRHVIPLSEGVLFKDITPAHYVEGPFMVKRNGTYYFMWSEGDWGDSSYGVAYAKSNNPTGPFVRVGKILQTDPAVASGPGHHSVLHIPGTDDWYIFYHRHPLNAHDPNERVLAVDRMYFNEVGDIEPVRLSIEGPGTRSPAAR